MCGVEVSCGLLKRTVNVGSDPAEVIAQVRAILTFKLKVSVPERLQTCTPRSHLARGSTMVLGAVLLCFCSFNVSSTPLVGSRFTRAICGSWTDWSVVHGD